MKFFTTFRNAILLVFALLGLTLVYQREVTDLLQHYDQKENLLSNQIIQLNHYRKQLDALELFLDRETILNLWGNPSALQTFEYWGNNVNELHMGLEKIITDYGVQKKLAQFIENAQNGLSLLKASDAYGFVDFYWKTLEQSFSEQKILLDAWATKGEKGLALTASKRFEQYYLYRYVYIAIFILICAAFSFIMVRMHLRFSRGIKRMQDFIEDVRNGIFEKNLLVFSDDELGDLNKQLSLALNAWNLWISDIQEVQSRIQSFVAKAQENVSEGAEATARFQEVSQSITVNATSLQQYFSNLSSKFSKTREGCYSFMKEIGKIHEHFQVMIDSAKNENTTLSKNKFLLNELDQSLTSLEKTTQNTDEILNIIQGLAHQTNLLSLNATIEANAAGEAAKGFQVVATEVKNLAQRTSQSTQNISAELKNIQDQSDKSVEYMSGLTSVMDDTVAVFQELENQLTTSAQQMGQSLLNFSDFMTATEAILTESREAAEYLSIVQKGITDFEEMRIKVSSCVDKTQKSIRNAGSLEGGND
ncbi:MAG: hypothetical protein A2Y14_03555 [Verrucomicrobia bacterium GWF2_51_19]|nr:MAG: hypothetical protein A2Y14_03555 [Verrucomicrobia bacterium GWF2_51_19]HCJ12401.1 hypothetical protein [Opitutae bacterium]